MIDTCVYSALYLICRNDVFIGRWWWFSVVCCWDRMSPLISRILVISRRWRRVCGAWNGWGAGRVSSYGTRRLWLWGTRVLWCTRRVWLWGARAIHLRCVRLWVISCNLLRSRRTGPCRERRASTQVHSPTSIYANDRHDCDYQYHNHDGDYQSRH